MTANITVTLTDTSGDPLVGARVNAKLFVPDRMDDFIVPENSNVTVLMDENGQAVLALWPNSDNTDISTYYRFRAWHPTTKAKVLDVCGYVDVDAALEHISYDCKRASGGDSETVQSAALAAHISSSNPHPNADFGGTSLFDFANATHISSGGTPGEEWEFSEPGETYAVTLLNPSQTIVIDGVESLYFGVIDDGVYSIYNNGGSTLYVGSSYGQNHSENISIKSGAVAVVLWYEGSLYQIGVATGDAFENVFLGASALGDSIIVIEDDQVYGNTAIGSNALAEIAAGTNYSTAVGFGALSDGATMVNCSALGMFTTVTGDNQVQLGNSKTTTYVYGTVQNRSDARDKTDIRGTELGLEFINALRPVDYRWDMREDYRPERPAPLRKGASNEEKAAHEAAMAEWREASKLSNIEPDGSKKRLRYHHGLIAQEVRAATESMGVDFGGFQDHSINGGEDVLSIGYDELIAPLIKAVQELAAENMAIKERLAKLEQ